MTLFIVTITDDFAVVSQDTFVSPLPWPNNVPLATLDAAKGQKPVFGEKRSSPPADKPKTFTSKIIVLPHLHMVVGGSGYYDLIMAWAHVLTVTAARDLVELDPIVPDSIKRVAAAIKTDEQAMIYHVGLDKIAGRMAGYFYNAADGYQATRLEPGHAMMPIPSPEHEDYAELARRWTPAAHGEGTEEFHARLAKNLYDSFWRGLYKLGSGIGGQLHTARIDRDGIGVRVAHEFPGYAEQLAALGGVREIASALAHGSPKR